MKLKELIERIKRLDESYLKTEFFLKLIEQLDEPQLVKVPQFVAEKIEYFKKTGDWDLFQAMDSLFGDKEIREWLEDKNNQELFTRAWLDGYEVEEEKRYRVKIKNVYHGDLGHAAPFEQFSFYTRERNRSGIRYEFTRKELEEAGFGWVFNCSGIEVQEVD